MRGSLTRIARPLRLSLILLIITLFLWIPPILFFARVIPPAVNRIFLKAPGLYLVFLGMVFCPLAAVWLGRRLVRSGERPLRGHWIMGRGALLFVMFFAVVGPPTIRRALEPRRPAGHTAPGGGILLKNAGTRSGPTAPDSCLGRTHDMVNHVFYDWGDVPGEIYDTDSDSFVNFVGNYDLPGPSSGEAPYDITVGGESGIGELPCAGTGSVPGGCDPAAA